MAFINCINAGDGWVIKNFVEDIIEFSNSFVSIKFSFTHQSLSGYARRVAKVQIWQRDGDFEWFDNFHSWPFFFFV